MAKILIIDDSRSVHAYVKEALGRLHQYHDAFDGLEGLQKLKDLGKGSVDFILLDWEMPILIGPETLKLIKQEFPETLVIMMTSRSSESDINSVFALGADEYVMKPFTKEILFEKITSVYKGSI